MNFPKAIFVLLLLPWAGLHANATSLQLRDHETGKTITGETISLAWKNDGVQGMVALDKYITVFNASSRTISVGVKKIEIDPLQQDISHSICFAGFCFIPAVYVSPLFEEIPAGKSDSGLETGFHGSYNFETSTHRAGIDRVAYVFYDEKNPADSAVIFVHYNTMALASNAVLPMGNRRLSFARYGSAQDRMLFRLPYAEGRPEALTFGLIGLSGEKVVRAGITRERDDITVETRTLHIGVYFLSVFAGPRLLGTERFTVDR